MSSGIGSASLMPAVTTEGQASAPATGPGGVGALGAPLAGGSPPTAGPGASPPTSGAPPTDAFASVLSTQVARTALAEGQSKKTSTKGGKPDGADADASGLGSSSRDTDA